MLILDCCDEKQSLDFKLYRVNLKPMPTPILQKLCGSEKPPLKFVPLYTEIKSHVKVSDADKVAMSAMISENKQWEDPVSVLHLGNESNQQSHQDMIVSMEKTAELIDNIYQYVCKCVTEEGNQDEENIKKIVARTLSDIPSLSYENVANNMFIKNRRDIMMINYLSKLTETQLCIAERISSGL